MKAVPGALPFGDAWVYEPKWDGHRALVRLRGGRVDVVSSTGKPRAEMWPWIGATVPAIVGADDVVLDGEVVAYGDDGRHSFGLVGRPDRRHSLVLFDVLRLDGDDLTRCPWHERRALLDGLVRPAGSISITPVSDDAELIEAATRAQHFEGVIAKRRDSLYVPGKRSSSWIKAKWRHEQEFVIGGYKVGEGNRSDTFGSLLLGVYPEALATGDDGIGTLQFVGAVGTGFDDATLRSLTAMLASRESGRCPFTEVPVLPGGRGRLRWVRPELVAQVSFGEWTADDILRHAVFLGLREDKPSSAVVRET